MLLILVVCRCHDSRADFHDKEDVHVGEKEAENHETPNVGNTSEDGRNKIPHKASSNHAGIVVQCTKQSKGVEENSTTDGNEHPRDVIGTNTSQEIQNGLVLNGSIVVTLDSNSHEDHGDDSSNDTNAIDNDDGTTSIAHANCVR